MKYFLKRVILFAAPIYIILVGVNICIDPSHEFIAENYYKKIAFDLSQDRHLANIDNLDYRRLMKEYIQVANPHNTIVLGSSTGMIIGKKLVGDKSMFNYCVTSGTLEDYLAIFMLLEKSSKLPKNIILATNPFIFSNDIQNERLYPIRDEYQEMLQKLNVQDDFPIPTRKDFIYRKIKILFSVNYFKESIVKWQTKLNTFSTTDNSLNATMKFSDGTINYFTYWNRDTSRVNSMARDYFNQDEMYNKVSTTKSLILDKFIDYIKSKDINIILYVSPFHPYTFEIAGVKDNSNVYMEYLRQLSLKKNIPMIGSCNPAEYNLLPTDFYDGMHIKFSGIEKVFIAEKDKLTIAGY
jgi:hypothetical protein